MRVRNSTRLTASATAVSAAVVLAACSQQHPADPGAQPIVKVNDRDIAMSQLNQLLHESGSDTPTAAATAHAVDSLIDEELLVQEAMKSHLQRDPTVAQAIERARRQILAHAYAEQVLFPKIPVTVAEQQRYYHDNPQLFSQRKTFQITAFTVDRADLDDMTRRELNRCHAVNEVRTVLEKRRIRFETESLRRSAEQLPLEQLPAFAKAQPGDLLLVHREDGRESLMAISAVEKTPITFERAKPIIEQYLVNTRNRLAMTEYLKRARAAAKISYADTGLLPHQVIREASTAPKVAGSDGV